MPSDFLLSILLGVVEGLTEFLPVSSTAHLRLTEALAHVDLADGYWKMYSIVIQLGAVLCLPFYFRERILAFVRTFPRGERGDRNVVTHPVSLAIVAFLCTAVPAFLMTKIIGKHLESLTVIGASLVVGGIVMWAVDVWAGPREAAGSAAHLTTRMDDMSLGQAVWIGLCQVLSAVFPGTSRSMATIAAGQLAGLTRASALEFSFFVSIPTMAVATGYDLLKALKPGGENPVGALHIDAHGWLVLAIGFVVAFVVAYATVAWFMAYVRRRGFIPFALYRIVLGSAVLIWASRL